MNKRTIVFQLLILALAALLATTSVKPAHAFRFLPSPSFGARAALLATTSPLVIPAAAFGTDGYAPKSTYFLFSGGYLRGEAPGSGCVKAPAYLPNYAKVTVVWASVVDNDSASDLYIDLWRVSNIDGNPASIMATLKSTGASTGVQVPGDYTINTPDVRYPDYSYYVTTCLYSTTFRLYSVRIYFNGPYTMYLPIVRK